MITASSVSSDLITINAGGTFSSNNYDFDFLNGLENNGTFTNSSTYILDHDVTITGLFEFNKSTFRNYSLSSIGFSNPDLSVQSVAAQPTGATTGLFENTLLSYGDNVVAIC